MFIDYVIFIHVTYIKFNMFYSSFDRFWPSCRSNFVSIVKMSYYEEKEQK